MEYSYFYIYQNFKKFIQPYRSKIILALVLQIIGSTVYLYWTYGFSQIVNFITNYQTGASLNTLYLLSAGVLSVLIIRVICFKNSRALIFKNTLRMLFDIENYSISHMSKIDISWHEKENAGNKVKRIERGANSLRELFRILIIRIVDVIISLIGTLIIISKFDIYISIAIIFYLLVYFQISSRFRRKIVESRKERNIKEEIYSGLFFEIMNNIRSVKVLDLKNGLLQSMKNYGNDLKKIIHNHIDLDQNGWAIRVAWEGIVRIALIIYIVIGITEGKYEIGFLVLFYGYFSSVSGSIENLSEITQEIAVSKASAIRLIEALETPVNIEIEDGKTNFPISWSSLSFKNLSFAYGENKVLSNINFEIKKGEKIGVVGLSGAGKSTLFKLLLKEHESTDGDIFIDETPLKTIKKSSYLKHVAPVLQETEVFNMPLKRNITLANIEQENNSSLFEKAIDTSHVKDFLNKLPLGVETIIGEKGVKLSGGEKQRVGIARAIFKDPQILLLDEATSHLDVESEGKIKDSLHQFFQGITAIVIAHRLSTIKEMDKIIVIENGEIIESGNFDELYSKDARFREFWDKQKIS